MPEAAAAAAPASADRARWQAFAVCVSVAALTILDLSKVNVALPSIEASLGAGSTELQLIVAGYALAYGLALVPSGRLGDLYSRRTMFIIGLTAFTATSTVCALAPNVQLLVIGRILQGVAAGIQMPQVIGLVQQLFQGEARARAFGAFGATVGITTALGPTLGGVLIAIGGPTDGWRWLFWMNVPLGLAAIWFAARLLPRTRSSDAQARQLDPIGILLLGITTFSLLLPFVLTTGSPSDDPRRWLWLGGMIFGGAAFVLWENRYKRGGRSPLVDFGLFRRTSYRDGILIAGVYFAAAPSMFLLNTLFLQEGLGLQPVFAGMVTIPFALASAVSAWVGGRLVLRIGRLLVVIGLCAVIAGFLLAALAATLPPAGLSPWLISAAMLLAGSGAGFVISPNQTLTLADVPLREAGVAGSLAQVAQRVGTAIGTAAVSAAFFSTIYREDGTQQQLVEYHDAYRGAVLIVLALVAAALALSLLDLLLRRHGTQTDPVAPAVETD